LPGVRWSPAGACAGIAIWAEATSDTAKTTVRDPAQILALALVRDLVHFWVVPVIQIPACRRFWEKDRLNGMPVRSHGRLSPDGVTLSALARRISESVLASDSIPNPVN
jgi:hypothetical protein